MSKTFGYPFIEPILQMSHLSVLKTNIDSLAIYFFFKNFVTCNAVFPKEFNISLLWNMIILESFCNLIISLQTSKCKKKKILTISFNWFKLLAKPHLCLMFIHFFQRNCGCQVLHLDLRICLPAVTTCLLPGIVFLL